MCQMLLGNRNASNDSPDMLEKLLEVYSDRFAQNFPIFTLRGTPEEAIVAILKHSLQTNVPFRADANPVKALY